MNSIKICTNSMAHINHFLMYVLGYKTFSILEDCCNLLGRYGKFFFLHNNSISLTKVWNKWKLCWYFLQEDVKLFLLNTASFRNWKLWKFLSARAFFFHHSVISMFREKHSAATEHLGSSQSSAQSTLGWAVIIGDRWRKVGEGPAIRPQPWQVWLSF